MSNVEDPANPTPPQPAGQPSSFEERLAALNRSLKSHKGHVTQAQENVVSACKIAQESKSSLASKYLDSALDNLEQKYKALNTCMEKILDLTVVTGGASPIRSQG